MSKNLNLTLHVWCQKGQSDVFTCPYHCIRTCDHRYSPYCIALALIQAKKGNLKRGFVFSGQNAYRGDRICRSRN